MTADQHATFHGAVVVSAGRTNLVQAFLSRQAVTYTWTAVPTQIQDQTQITVEAEFEVNVPEPVIVPTSASLISPLSTSLKFMDVPFSLANHGLIGVQGVTITAPFNPNYRFDLATLNIGEICPRCRR